MLRREKDEHDARGDRDGDDHADVVHALRKELDAHAHDKEHHEPNREGA